ncbi:LamG domain-containing protein [Mesorhizobium sp. M3A.F.Ca.ET.174.01.1.1]|uniref:LamG domain-containing protein n=1 Tax=unclassified Mesorhizobium TaxID=325217 RepID=UPI0010933CA3|nr:MULTISPECIES: LamG domain-containing protein [unclassified Mesorhizobium]TGS89471.1 LamG domain-containing protein [Mesorhizobium sp. M3A.F.Ca.ET.175.01.1.1]TGT31244.1 LamG domain-containing protein [Mesorhizobium sp. M3A.F.Ca.ET.174.01.1.1]
MFVHMLGGRGPGAYVGPGSGNGDGDGFGEQPVVTTTASGDTTIKGKVKSGSFGKFVYPLATVAAGRQYTFRYTPHFAQLMQQGKLAMVGFGFKTDNDFHLVGLRGDGSTGIHKYKVYGTPPNGWNQQTGHTTVDGGASVNGTQAGPNWIRLVISADGTTYTFKTSPDGSTWSDEYSGATPSPFSNVSGVDTFGVALWFSNTDAGIFSIDIDQFADTLAPDPYFSNVVLLLGFEGTDGATTTTDESPSAHSFTFNGNAQIDTAQAKIGSSSCLFDGTGDYLSTPDHADWLLSSANSDQFTIEFWIRPHANLSNQRVMGQAPASGNWAWDINSTFSSGTGTVSFRYTSDGGTATILGTTAAGMSLDTWYYIAVSKNSSGKIRIWRNGNLDNSTTPANSAMFNSTGAFEIGRNFNQANLNGWLDEIRITKGVCRYDTDGSISVPTAAFPRS